LPKSAHDRESSSGPKRSTALGREAIAVCVCVCVCVCACACVCLEWVLCVPSHYQECVCVFVCAIFNDVFKRSHTLDQFRTLYFYVPMYVMQCSGKGGKDAKKMHGGKGVVVCLAGDGNRARAGFEQPCLTIKHATTRFQMCSLNTRNSPSLFSFRKHCWTKSIPQPSNLAFQLAQDSLRGTCACIS
jgi:hypothetical protein